MTRVGPAGDPRLEVDVLASDRVALARVAGTLDASSAPALISVLLARLGNGSVDIVLDVGSLEFCDSAGLHALLVVRRRQPPGATLTLARARPGLVRLIELAGTDAEFDIAGR